MDEATYMAMLKRYYDWYEMHKYYPYGAVSAVPMYPQLAPGMDLRNLEAMKYHMSMLGMPPFCYPGDPRLLAAAAQSAAEPGKPAAESSTAASLTETSTDTHHQGQKRSSASITDEKQKQEALDLSNKKARLCETNSFCSSSVGLNSTRLGTPLPAHHGVSSLGYPSLMDPRAFQPLPSTSSTSLVPQQMAPFSMSPFGCSVPFLGSGALPYGALHKPHPMALTDMVRL